jgi:hypothetical protein
MCDAKAPGSGARLTTESGVIYYPNTPEGDAAMRSDMAKTMGAGAGEDSQPPAQTDEPETPPTGCENYSDSMWDKNCSKSFRYSNMGRKPVGGSVSTQDAACNWKGLCENILDPIKAKFPGMTISSGFRPTSFNGSTSDHTKGKAADIQLLQGDAVEGAKKMFKWIGASGLPFSQVIFEGRWVHVAYRGSSPASVAVLVTRNGAAPYQNGGGRGGSALPPDLRWA